MADDLMEWSLEWARYLRQRRTTSEILATTGLVVEPSQEEIADALAQRVDDEVCADQVEGDAATAFMPDVPLPFGGGSTQD